MVYGTILITIVTGAYKATYNWGGHIVEIVDLASYQMVIFHSYVNVYQGVDPPNQSKR